MNERVNGASVGGVLPVITVQPPSVDRNTGGHLFGIPQHVVNGADSTKGPRRIVLKGVHDQISSRCNASSGCIARTITEHRCGDVCAVATVGVSRGGVEPKLRVGGRYTSSQIRVILVQTGVGNRDHLSGAVKGKRGVVGNTLNPSDGPCEGVVDTKF